VLLDMFKLIILQANWRISHFCIDQMRVGAYVSNTSCLKTSTKDINGMMWVPKRIVSLKHSHFLTHSRYAKNYTFFIYMNFMTNSWESCNTPSKILLNRKDWIILIFLFIPLLSNLETIPISDLRLKEQFWIPIYREIVHKHDN